MCMSIFICTFAAENNKPIYTDMRRILFLVCAALALNMCDNTQEQLKQRAAELCQYIPDHELKKCSRYYMTEDFYNVLDTMFNLPAHEAMDHEWLYYFVTGNGGTVPEYEVIGVELTDENHAVATIRVRQTWEDGYQSEDNGEDRYEDHSLYMERVNEEWLISDFDGHKADCINYIANNKKEQAVRAAIFDYLVSEIGPKYEQGDLCFPTLMIVAEDEVDSTQTMTVWGDFWVEWYNRGEEESLQFVSGGNHAGRLTLIKDGNQYTVKSFEQTVDGAKNEASAKRIFGKHYEVYQGMHSNQDVRDAVRQEQMDEYFSK